MNKFIIALTVAFMAIAMTGCTEKISVDFECKKGVVYYDYKRTIVETGSVVTRMQGITTYKDGTVIKCDKVD